MIFSLPTLAVWSLRKIEFGPSWGCCEGGLREAVNLTIGIVRSGNCVLSKRA